MDEIKVSDTESKNIANDQKSLKRLDDRTEIRTSDDSEAGESANEERQAFFSEAEVARTVKREVEFHKAKAKVAELESQIKRSEFKAIVIETAHKAGSKNASLLFRIVEEQLETGEDGQPKNLDEVIRIARRDYPELFRRDANGNANGGAGQQNNPRLSMNELLRKGRQ
jgi:hypothetical protein